MTAWNVLTKAYLKFPLFVAYLMWLQMASNIPLVVVTKRQSNTCKQTITQKKYYAAIWWADNTNASS